MARARHVGLLPMGTVFIGQERFEARVRQLRPIADRVRALPIGERTAWFGQMLLGTPYKGYTLEIDDQIEAPSVNLHRSREAEIEREQNLGRCARLGRLHRSAGEGSHFGRIRHSKVDKLKS